ncbi:MAG: hypothetical protein K2L95_03960 [Alphaproteobacteria bacterium]|nr:hypothetical protein [Alphaproteobacteria bacterium]MDE6571338.1 hypothetical protein [Alphaproteobacteria bacterium]
MRFKNLPLIKIDYMLQDLHRQGMLLEAFATGPVQHERAREIRQHLKTIHKLYRMVGLGYLSGLIGILGMMAYDKVTHDDPDRMPVGLVVYPSAAVAVIAAARGQEKMVATAKNMRRLFDEYNRAGPERGQ